MSHSKRNTTRPVFTAHERNLAKSSWTSSSARLNRDSFLSFGSCTLCLVIARDPISCQKGDLFCRECALANILAQKKELKRTEKIRKAAEEDTAKTKAAQDEEDQQRALKDFELTQAGFTAAKQKRSAETAPDDGPSGTRRKFTLDEEEIERIAKEDRNKARKAIDDENASKAILPSFWTPSLTPSTDPNLAITSKKQKTIATCPASTESNTHAFSLQKLTTVHFNEEGNERTCPSCRKKLSNASNAVMANKCGHVLCMNCVTKFLLPSKKEKIEEDVPVMCFVCDVPVAIVSPELHASSDKRLPPGLVALRSEGTGFSAKGTNTVEKSNVGFQC